MKTIACRDGTLKKKKPTQLDGNDTTTLSHTFTCCGCSEISLGTVVHLSVLVPYHIAETANTRQNGYVTVLLI